MYKTPYSVSSLTLSLGIGLFLAWSSVQSVSAQARNDLDSDGLSEIGCVNIDSEGALDWQILSSAASYATSLSDLEDFGEAGNQVAYLDWDGDGIPDLGRAEKQGKNVVWTAQTGSGELSTTFGKSNNIVIPGNVDGGAGDIFLVGKKKKKVSGLLNAFDESNREQISFPLSKRAVRKVKGPKAEPTFLQGAGGSQLGVVYKLGNRWRYIANDFSDGSKVRTRLESSVKGKLIEAPAILDGDSAANILLHEKLSSTKLRVRIFNPETGSLLFSNNYDGTLILVGTFSAGATGEQFAVVNGSTLTVVSPFGGEGATLSLPSCIYFDLNNINQFTKGSGNGGGDDDGGEGGPGLNAVCKNIVNPGKGRLYKNKADAEGRRKDKGAFLLTGANKNGVSKTTKNVYDSNGKKFCSLGFKASSIPGVNNAALHWFIGWIKGCGFSPEKLAKTAKQNTGNTTIYVQIEGKKCMRVPDPRNRYGSI